MPVHTIEPDTVLVFWQDKRLKEVCRILTQNGYKVILAGRTLLPGLPPGISLLHDWKKISPSVRYVLLPIPAVREDGMIAFPDEEIAIETLFQSLSPGTLLIGGMLSEHFRSKAKEYHLRVADDYESETVKRRNGELTAEAAISVAMNELPVSLCEMRAAVVGCGRIGSALCRYLRLAGADVTAFARRRESLLPMEEIGCKTVLLHSPENRELLLLKDSCDGSPRAHVLFNTVPEKIFSSGILTSLCASQAPNSLKNPLSETLFIDLSSSPGGFDREAVRIYGIKLLHLLSLPGKYAPDSAGRILGDEILRLLSTTEGAEKKEELP